MRCSWGPADAYGGAKTPPRCYGIEINGVSGVMAPETLSLGSETWSANTLVFQKANCKSVSKLFDFFLFSSCFVSDKTGWVSRCYFWWRCSGTYIMSDVLPAVRFYLASWVLFIAHVLCRLLSSWQSPAYIDHMQLIIGDTFVSICFMVDSFVDSLRLPCGKTVVVSVLFVCKSVIFKWLKRKERY